ncbi:hypothetical protein [Rhodobacter sp. JA431]|uniref:hypothetical protein n=1 Tax=Rhodobacter sp. JA431 TaxID=570013 RepID=UPI001160DD6F|nr:hypothetical protein [Rhodobacter sp. JA431]
MATAFTAMGVGAINAGLEIQRLSTLANTPAEQFQRWAAGARSVGIEQDKLSDILKDTNDRVGDFLQTGGGEMADFFEKIAPKVGVTAAQFRGLSGADALQLYVSSLEKASLSQAELIYYMEAVADEASGLLPLLRNGGEGMKQYGDMAERVGAIMDDKTKASMLRGAAALAEMRMAWGGVRNTIGAQVVPALVAAAGAVTALATAFRTHADTIMTVMQTLAGTAAVVATIFAGRYAIALGVSAVRAMAQAVSQSIALEMALGAQTRAAAMASVATKGLSLAMGFLKGALIATGIGALVVGAGYLVGKFMALVTAAGGFGNAMKLLGEVASGVWRGMVTAAGAVPAGLSAVWAQIRSSFFGLVADMQGAWFRFLVSMSQSALSAGFDGVASKLASAAESAGSSWDSMRDSAEAAGIAAGAMGAIARSRLSAGLDEAGAAAKKLAEAVATTNDELTTLNNGGGTGGAGGGGGAAGRLSDLQRVVKSLNEDIARLRATMFASETDKNIFDKLKEAGVSAASTSGQQIAALVQQRDAMQRLQDATESWKQSITSAFSSFVTGAISFKQMLGQIIAKLAEMVMNSAFEKLFSGGGGGILGGILSAFGIGANANGTSNWRGGLTQINERGGEIVDLPSGTRIIPHDVSKRMMNQGASQIVQTASELTLSDDGRIMATVRAEMGQMAAAQDKALPTKIQQYSMNSRKRY